MQNARYRYEPKCVDEIVIRPFAFDFPDDLGSIWAPANVSRSLLLNGLSMTMLYLIAALPEGAPLPLLDTQHPDMPVPNLETTGANHG